MLHPKEKIPIKDNESEINETLIDGVIENILAKNAEKINEGNNGIIFLINLHEVDKRFLDYLKTITSSKMEQTENSHEQLAIKMMKVYTGGQGKQEFLFQKKAWEIIQKKKKKEPNLPLAQVPLPYFYRNLDISQNTTLKNKLKVNHVKIYNQQIEVILMNFVPGKDLATFLYQQVLKYHPETKYLTQNNNTALDEMNIEQLGQEVARALKFSYPPASDAFVDDRIIKVFNNNKELLINFLKKQHKNGFELPKHIIAKIKNTIDLFHQNGFEHNDLHERNVLISEKNEIYIIDFGAASSQADKKNELQGTDEDARKAEIEQILRDDTGLLRSLEKLNISQEDESKKEKYEELKRIIEITEKIIKNKNKQKELKKIILATDDLENLLDNIYSLVNKLTYSPDLQAQLEAGLLYKFLEKNSSSLSKEKLERIIAGLKKNTPYQRNLINLVVKNFKT